VGGFRLRWLAVLLSVLAGSQLGHTIVYLLRYGIEAPRHESAGVHAYYPTLAAVVGAALGVGLTFGLLLVAVARGLFLAPPGYRQRGTVRFIDVLSAAFVAQLLIFVGQEFIEALAAGGAIPSTGDLLLWGALGQLPAACVAAAMIRWLLARVERAWSTIIRGVPRHVSLPVAAAPGYVAWPESDRRLQLGSAFPSAFRKRGPPRRPALA